MSAYQNIDDQSRAQPAQPYAPSPTYIPSPAYAPATSPYQPNPDHENIYTPSGNTEVSERPSPMSLAGALMIFGSFLLFLSVIASIISLAKIGSHGARVRITHTVDIHNAHFTYGFLNFLNLLVGPIVILAEIRYPLISELAHFLGTFYGRACFYFIWGLINLGFSGDFGIAVGAMMIFNAAFNLGAGFHGRSQ